MVFGFLKKLGQSESGPPQSPETEPLRGVPPGRRIKHYAAASGYGYEYYFEGYRNRPSVREYVFSMSGDRKNWRALSILLPEAAIENWQRRNGRTLADNERYAIAKLSLFLAFDETESPPRLPRSLTINATQSEEIIGRIGFD